MCGFWRRDRPNVAVWHGHHLKDYIAVWGLRWQRGRRREHHQSAASSSHAVSTRPSAMGPLRCSSLTPSGRPRKALVAGPPQDPRRGSACGKDVILVTIL